MKTIKISSPAFSSEIFQVVKLSGRESVNELFQYQILLKTPDLDQVSFVQQFGSNSPAASVDLTAWIGQSVNVSIELDGKEISFTEKNNTFLQTFKKTVGQGIRYLDGIITNADYLYDQGRSSYYCLSIRPFVYPATLNQNHRIFQDKTVIEILDEVLSAYPGTVEKCLEEQKAERYTKRDYQTQFGESDFRFFARLCAEWGINYWFEHGSDGHTLILSDEPQNHKAMPSEAYHRVAYYPQGHKINEEYLHEFNVLTRMVSGAFASADYDYAQASSTIQNHRHNSQPYPEAQKQGKTTGKVSEQIASQEVFDYAADVVQPEAGPHQQGNHSGDEQVLRDLWNLERLQQTHLTAVASGNIRGIVTGHQFNLEKHPSALANINWAVKSTELLIMDLAEESQRKEGGFSSLLTDRNNLSQALTDKVIKKFDALLNNSNQKWQIECTAELIPANVPIRPEHIEKPRGALQNALVVGEGDADSIYTDRFGRIKVQFYWDRYGGKDEQSSCWIRVNEPWAGNQMGAVFTPRIGQEVLIDYINNDPDLPICIGKVNNSDNLPPWALAQNKALSGFRSRELPEGNCHSGRSNHLVFDDSADKIQTQLKSDHAHSQLSLGDITRIEDNQGRKDARGQGFELRTDDWGSARAAKGLYLTTFPRSAAASTTMDAYEAQQLLEEARKLVEQLSDLAKHHKANPLSATEPLNKFSNITKSKLPEHPDAKDVIAGTTGIAGDINSSSGNMMDAIMGKSGFSLDTLTNQIDEINVLKSVLPNGLPNEVKAKATEDVLKNLAKQEINPPIKPIVNAGELHYNGAMELFEKQLKDFENNPYDKARQKLDELANIDLQEKTQKLLTDKGIQNIFSNLKANGKSYEQLQDETPEFSPKGFEKNILVGAGEAGIALVTPKETHQYSAISHTITAGQDFNISIGNSWLNSIGKHYSTYVQNDIKLYSGQGNVSIQAQNNHLEIIADKTLKIFSNTSKVEVAADKEIFIACGGAYIRLRDGNIDLHAPGTIEHKAAQHLFNGPTSKYLEFAKNKPICIECLRKAAQAGLPFADMSQ